MCDCELLIRILMVRDGISFTEAYEYLEYNLPFCYDCELFKPK
jgi:hypothetical protein